MLGCWLILIGLGLRAWHGPFIAGSYNSELDDMLYSGQRLLKGGLLYADHFLPIQPIAQYLFAPSAWLGSMKSHRLLVVLFDGLSGLLLVRTLRLLSSAQFIPLQANSPVPLISGMLYIILSQMIPGGAAGHLHHFTNGFLVAALFFLSRSLAAERSGCLARGDLLRVGAFLFLALNCFVSLSSTVLVAAGVVLVLRRQALPALGMLGLGGLLAAFVVFLPFLLVPAGPALAWGGAVLLPIQWAGPDTAQVGPLVGLTKRLLSLRVAGLPVWLLSVLPGIGLLHLATGQWRKPEPGSDQPLLVPTVALIVLGDMSWSLQRGQIETHDLLLAVLPLVLLIAAGLAALEHGTHRVVRALAMLSLWVFSLIFFNNIVLATVFNPPPQPRRLVAELEGDRSLVRNYLSRLEPGQRSFSSPQDAALQWQVGMPASTLGIGPDWSLNQQNLTDSWATRTLGLPVDKQEICAQLTAPSNLHLVWRSTDPKGPNSEKFLLSCLATSGARWEEISERLQLRTGQFKVFRRTGL